MVVIIVGILVSFAIPRYLKTVEKSRMAEAYMVLGSVRTSQVRSLLENSTYASSLAQLDFDPSAAGAFSGAPIYAYSIAPGAGPAGFVAVATRGSDPPLTLSGCATGYTIRLNHDGLFAGRDCQSTALTAP